jgi:hypothetical protein
VYAVKFAPGEWAREYWGADLRWRGLLAQQALSYHLERQQPEKRLAKYLAFHFRMDARGGRAALRRSVADLLDVAGITVNQHRPEERTKQRLEKALDQLARDKILKGWTYVHSGDLPAREWVPAWLRWAVDLVPSEQTTQYHVQGGVRRALPAGDATAGETLIERD